MNPPISTYVHGHDPISQAGVISQLRMRPEVRVVDDIAQASVALVVADAVDQDTIRQLRTMRRDGQPRLILVATAVDDAAVVAIDIDANDGSPLLQLEQADD